MPSWSDAGSRVARDDVAASRFPQRSAAEQAHKPCVVVRLLHNPALFRRLSRRHVLSSSPYSLASRARSQLAAVVHLTPRAALQLPCSRLPLHCFTGDAGCAHASGCGKPQLHVPSHVKRAPIVVPFFLPHHSDSRYACMAREHERTARPRYFLDVRYPADASRMHKTIKYGQNRGGYRARRGGYSRTLGTTCVLTLWPTWARPRCSSSPNVGPRHVMPNVRNLVARRADTNADAKT